MTARIFISYRTSDGADKAAALARDLAALFGDGHVFLDKTDLPAGARWREGIEKAIGAAPILIVLVTPNYLGARDADGHLCIERSDDPVRDELETGIAAGATIVPLLCDGVAAPPEGRALPRPFDQLSERHWGRLRAFDWNNDMARLAADLERLGLVRRAAIHSAGRWPRRRVVVAAAAGVVTLAAAGGAGWYWAVDRDRLSGSWRARIGARGATSAREGEPIVVNIEQRGDAIRLASSAVEIDRRAEWQAHRDAWRQRFGSDLTRVFYRGRGHIVADPGAGASPVAVRRIVVDVSIVPAGAEPTPIDVGSLRGIVDDDLQRIHARLWLDSERAERVVELRRAE